MKYNVLVKRGPFDSYDEAQEYATLIGRHDPERVKSLGVIPAMPPYYGYQREPLAPEGAWWLKPRIRDLDFDPED